MFLRSASFDELMGIDSIGDVVANKILNFFKSDPIGIDALLVGLVGSKFSIRRFRSS